MTDYDRIAKVIFWLVENYREQPSLDTLADVAGISRFHFHRTFRQLAGTTPKAFLQHLTMIEAGRLLRDGMNVFDTSLEVGLSGPGRLHDVCVKLEAASPGEIRSGGAGWEISGGFAPTPFGRAFIAEGPRGICRFTFPEDLNHEEIELQKMWPNAAIHRDDAFAAERVSDIFSTDADTAASLQVLVKGSDFQLRVWRALLDIPFGKVTTYQTVAETLQKPTASRAVGNAAGQNPVSWLIPCHRVIAATGRSGNYRWHPDRKKALLAWEAAVAEGQNL